MVMNCDSNMAVAFFIYLTFGDGEVLHPIFNAAYSFNIFNLFLPLALMEFTLFLPLAFTLFLPPLYDPGTQTVTLQHTYIPLGFLTGNPCSYMSI
jgi:hypothetical protein